MNQVKTLIGPTASLSPAILCLHWRNTADETNPVSSIETRMSETAKIDIQTAVTQLATSGQGAFPALNGFEIRIGDCATHRETDDFRLVI